MKNLKGVKKAIGSITRTSLLILLALTTCTCSGLKLTWVPLNTEKQTDYFLYSGKHVKPINDVMECAISKTDALALVSWHRQKPLTWLQYHPTHALGYCPNLVGMQKRCSQIKLYLYPLTTHSFSSRYKMEWTAQNQNLRTEYRRQNLLVSQSKTRRGGRSYRDSIPQSTGRTRAITPTTGRN